MTVEHIAIILLSACCVFLTTLVLGLVRHVIGFVGRVQTVFSERLESCGDTAVPEPTK